MNAEELIANNLEHFFDIGALLGTGLEVDGLTLFRKLLPLLERYFLFVVHVQHSPYEH